MKTVIRLELIEETNLMKRLVNDAFVNQEIDSGIRMKLLEKIGALKSILLSESDFERLYKSSDYSRRKAKVRLFV